MIAWRQILYGAALSISIATAVLVVVLRQRDPRAVWPAATGAFLGPLSWNAILHRAATPADGFFVDIPFPPFPVSWQDTGSGVFTLAVASVLLSLTLPREAARRILRLAAAAALVAFLVDIYLY